MPHRKYRALERECQVQAAMTGDKKTKEELNLMAREYRQLADWLERQLPEADGRSDVQ